MSGLHTSSQITGSDGDAMSVLHYFVRLKILRTLRWRAHIRNLSGSALLIPNYLPTATVVGFQNQGAIGNGLDTTGNFKCVYALRIYKACGI
jgi:hypothetical protein